jgi:hypothetical protein
LVVALELKMAALKLQDIAEVLVAVVNMTHRYLVGVVVKALLVKEMLVV